MRFGTQTAGHLWEDISIRRGGGAKFSFRRKADRFRYVNCWAAVGTNGKVTVDVGIVVVGRWLDVSIFCGFGRHLVTCVHCSSRIRTDAVYPGRARTMDRSSVQFGTTFREIDSGVFHRQVGSQVDFVDGCVDD